MATKQQESTGTVLQSWVSPKFAREVKELADQDGRSVSNLIKVCLRDRLLSETSPSGGGGATVRGGSSRSGSSAPAASAGPAEGSE